MFFQYTPPATPTGLDDPSVRVTAVDPTYGAGTRYYTHSRTAAAVTGYNNGWAPVRFSKDFYVTQVGILLAAPFTGDSTSLRIGIYDADPATVPAYRPKTLVHDFGTLTISNPDSPGLKTLTPGSKVKLDAGKTYWVGAHVSAAGPTVPTLLLSVGNAPYMDDYGFAANIGEVQVSGLGVAGTNGTDALAATFSNTPATRASVPRVYLKGDLTA